VLTGKDPVEITAVDVFEFLTHQRGDRSVVRLADRESGLSARTIARRLSSVSGLHAYLVAGMTRRWRLTRCRGACPRRQGGSRTSRMVSLVRVPRTLAVVLAMLLAGQRRCEVLGLRLVDVRAGARQLFIAEGKGGHHRVNTVADHFLRAQGDYLHDERPETAATDRLFVVLKGPRRGMPLSAEGLDEILSGFRGRARAGSRDVP
jgi:site-specific recombinase XerD